MPLFQLEWWWGRLGAATSIGAACVAVLLLAVVATWLAKAREGWAVETARAGIAAVLTGSIGVGFAFGPLCLDTFSKTQVKREMPATYSVFLAVQSCSLPPFVSLTLVAGFVLTVAFLCLKRLARPAASQGVGP